MSLSPCLANLVYRAALILTALALTSPLGAALKVGGAQTDLTPKQPVLLAGQFHVRVSEGVIDPITATVLVLEHEGDHAVFVSCDVVSIPDALRTVELIRGYWK